MSIWNLRIGPYLERGSSQIQSAKIRSYWSKVDPNPTTDVLMRKKNKDTETPRDRTQSCEEKDRNWSHTSTSQGTPRISRNHQKLKREARKDDSPLELSEGTQPCQHMDSRLPAFKILKEQISVVVRHPVCGNMLQQP